MKNFRLILYSLLLLILSSACKEDFELNAPWKDISVVYGLLDSSQDTVFLRINKAYLGSGNVLEMAKIADSSNYKSKLQVELSELDNNNTLVNTYTLDTLTIDNKQDGLFYNPYQLLYFVPLTVSPDRTYKLNITLNDKEIEATTNTIAGLTMKIPSAGLADFEFKRSVPNSKVEWKSAKYGKRYEVNIRFNFKELMDGSTDTIFRHVDWFLGTFKSETTAGSEDMFANYTNNGFYANLQNSIPYSDPAKEAAVSERFTSTVEYQLAVAGDELNTYLEVNGPSNSIIQDRPEYTNLTNAIGIFSSRNRLIREKKLRQGVTIQEIKNLNLHFVY